MAKCDICENEHNEDTKSCAVCNKIFSKHKKKITKSKIRNALRDKIDLERSKGSQKYFRCHYTNILSKFPDNQEILNPLKQAFCLTFDHVDPKENGDVVVSLNIINQMKNELPADDFIKIVILMGKYFDKNLIHDEFEFSFKQIINKINEK